MIQKTLSPLSRILLSTSYDGKIVTYSKVILSMLILLLVFTPVVFSFLTERTWLSAYVLGAFLRELFISIVLVIIFMAISRILNAVIYKLMPSVVVPTYNEMLLASEVGAISYREMSDVQLMQSLKKWMWQEDEIGWLELQEITQGQKLREPRPILMVKEELYRVQQEKKYKVVERRNHGYEEKLKSLLASHDSMSLNQLYRDFDKGNISEDYIKNSMVVNYFTKWINRGDEAGWMALDEISREKRSLIGELAQLALWRLEEQKHTSIDETNQLRLRSLLVS